MNEYTRTLPLSRKKTAHRKESGGVLAPVLRLHLVLCVVRVSFLKVCSMDDVSFFNIGDHVLARHALHYRPPVVREEAEQGGRGIHEEVGRKTCSPHHCLQ